VMVKTDDEALGALRPQDTSALNYSAEVSRQFGTGGELSGHFGTDLYETLRHHVTLTFRSVCGRLTGK